MFPGKEHLIDVRRFAAMLVSAAVMSVFVAFAGLLLWSDFQTRPAQLRAQKRRR